MLATHQLKNTPTGVAVDGSGTVYVTDTGNNRVLKLPAG
jgi:serine/threonine protein kinase, bacterial